VYYAARLFDNHKSELIKSIIEIYLNLRLFHEAKRAIDMGRKERMLNISIKN